MNRLFALVMLFVFSFGLAGIIGADILYADDHDLVGGGDEEEEPLIGGGDEEEEPLIGGGDGEDKRVKIIDSESLANPIAKIGSIDDLLAAILDILVRLAIPVIVLFIIYAGFLYVTARGNPEKITAANKTILWTLVGAVIILGAKALQLIILGTVETFK